MKLKMPEFGILRGVNVAVHGSAVAGPFCGCLLGEHGAQVIHIEGPDQPDYLRSYEKGYFFALDRRNMFNMTLDYSTDEGREIFQRLIKELDIYIENQKGGTYAKWGLTDEVLWGWNPKLVIVHISGFGQSGDPEYVKRASYDFTGQAFSGLAAHNGTPDSPQMVKPPLCDYGTGMNAAFAAMAALYRVQVSGEGESIDVTQFETFIRIQQFQSILGFTEKVNAPRFEGINVTIVGDSFYKTKDGKFVSCFMSGPKVIERGLKMLGLDEDPLFKGRTFNNIYKSDEVAEPYLKRMREFCAERTYDEIEADSKKFSVPISIMMEYTDMLENPHYQARESICEYYSDYMGFNVKAPAPEPKLTKNPGMIWRGGVGHGEDNEEILKELGYSDAEIQKMHEQGTIKSLFKTFTEGFVKDKKTFKATGYLPWQIEALKANGRIPEEFVKE